MTENGGWVADILRLLVVSRLGLTVPDLLELLDALGYHGDTRVTHSDVMALFDVMCDAVLHEAVDGLFVFSHQHLREAVEHTLLSECDSRLNISTMVMQ